MLESFSEAAESCRSAGDNHRRKQILADVHVTLEHGLMNHFVQARGLYSSERWLEEHLGRSKEIWTED